MDDEPAKKDEGGGAPAWVMTFADLMSLLMCFFVLLLSFSEMDIQKYKQIAGSMKMAFGVQKQIRAYEIPKGTSVVAKEFSPANPEPTIVNQVRQKTTKINYKKLESSKEGQLITENDARKIAKALDNEIKSGEIEVETEDEKIVIRILDKGSFASGTAILEDEFLPVITKIKLAIKDIEGDIKIAGHTDDRPISTPQYRSNWELSAARAVSVAHALMEGEAIDQSRFQILGHADTKPRVANDNDINRAKNRRVDIVVVKDRTKMHGKVYKSELQKIPVL